MEISTKIKQLRDSHGYSQDYVAEQIGISQAAYSKLESGQTKTTIDRAQQLAKFYDVDTEFFFSSDSKFTHYGKDSSYGPIQTNNNYYADEKITNLYNMLLEEKNRTIEEYKEMVDSLKAANASITAQLLNMTSLLKKK